MKKSVKIAIISIVAVLVVAGVSLAIFWGNSSYQEPEPSTDTSTDTSTETSEEPSKSPEEYYAYIEKSNIEATASAIHSLFNFDTAPVDYKKGSESSFKVEFGEELSPVVNTIFGSEIDINWLKSVELLGETYGSSDKLDMSLIAKLNEKEVISASIMADMETQIIYASIPLITNDKFVKIDYKELMGIPEGSEGETIELSATDIFFGSGFEDLDFSKIIPTEEVISALLSDYFDVIVNAIENVEKTTDNLTIDGVTQSCTLIRFVIDEEDFNNTLKAVLEKAKDDDRIEKIIKDFALEMKEDGEDLYEEFTKSIQEAIDSLSKDIEELNSKSEEDIKKESIVFKTWVNTEEDIVARSFETLDDNDKSSFFMGTAKNGSDVATQVSLYEESGNQNAEFIGKGTLENGVISGKYTLYVEGKETVIFNVKDFDLKGIKEDKLAGELSISMGKDFADFLKGQAPAEILEFISKLEIKLTSFENTVDFELLSNGKCCVKMSVSYKDKEYREPSIPAGDKVIDLNDEEALMQIIMNFNPQTIINKFVEAGFPQDLIDSMFSENVSPELPDEDWDNGEVWEDWESTETFPEL
jgi:hypothetical protein